MVLVLVVELGRDLHRIRGHVLSVFVPKGLNDRSQAIYCLVTITSPFGTTNRPYLSTFSTPHRSLFRGRLERSDRYQER
jgi:hypothetical protein